MSEREDELIAKYACGHYASYVRKIAELHGGIVRVENGEFILADGLTMGIMPKPLSMFERWAEEEKYRPADWLQVRDDSEKIQALA